jgi:hypothetical protein
MQLLQVFNAQRAVQLLLACWLDKHSHLTASTQSRSPANQKRRLWPSTAHPPHSVARLSRAPRALQC